MGMTEDTAQKSPTAISSSAMTTDQPAPSPARNAGLTDIGLLVLRLGAGGAALQAGLIKPSISPRRRSSWRTRMATPEVRRVHGDDRRDRRRHRAVTGRADPTGGVRGAQRDALRLGGQRLRCGILVRTVQRPVPDRHRRGRLLFAGAGSYSVDSRFLRRFSWSSRLIIALLVLAVAAAVLTWVALYGVNPIHFTAPAT